MLGDYETRLRRVENMTPSTFPCKPCQAALAKVEIDLKNTEETLKHERLETRHKLEEHATFVKARYQALEEKVDRLALAVKELPSMPAHWQIANRLEVLEQEKRWNDRVRRLGTFGAPTPEPVLRHLEYLESRLRTILYDRDITLPNAVARSRVSWAWDALEKSLKAEPQETAPTQVLQVPDTFHQQPRQTHQPQEPPQGQVEVSSHLSSQEGIPTEPAVPVDATSQPIGDNEAVLSTPASDQSQETSQMQVCPPESSLEPSSSHEEAPLPAATVVAQGVIAQTASDPPTVQSFDASMGSGVQAPPVNVPAMDWSASVSVDLSRDKSEFDDDDTPRINAPVNRLPTITEQDEMEVSLPIGTGSSEAGTSSTSTVPGHSVHTGHEASTQIGNTSEQTQGALNIQQTVFAGFQIEGLQNPFSVTTPQTNNNGNDTSTIQAPTHQNQRILQQLPVGYAFSGNTIVSGAQSTTQPPVSPMAADIDTTAESVQQLPVHSGPSPNHDAVIISDQPEVRFGPPEATQQQIPHSHISNSSVISTPAQQSSTNPPLSLILPVGSTPNSPAVEASLPVAAPAVHGSSPDEE